MVEIVPCEAYRFLPPLARSRVAALHEATGIEPSVTRLDNGFRVAIASPRVALTMDWRRPPRARAGAWSYHSALCVDGSPVPLVKNVEAFVKLWNDPDMHNRPRYQREREQMRDAQIPELGEPHGPAPAPIEMLYRRNRSSAERHGGGARLGHADGRWQLLVNVTLPDGENAQVYIAIDEACRDRIELDQVSVIISIEGKDCTHLANELDLAALGLEMPHSPPPAETLAGKPRRESGGARHNSVEVRRAAVIRT